MVAEDQVAAEYTGFCLGRLVWRGCTIIFPKAEDAQSQKLGVEAVAEGEYHHGYHQQNQRIHDLSAPLGAM